MKSYFDAMELYFEIFLGINEWNDHEQKREDIPPF